MRRLVAVLPLAALLVPAAAHGAAVQTDRACYLDTPKTTVTLTANGYTPARPYNVSLDGTTLTGGSGTMDGAGAMRGAFNPPDLTKAQNQRTFTVGVASDALAAQTTFTVTRFKAGFTPSQGDPATLKVRFSVSGFALAAPDPVVYVHYVTPAGKLKATVRLGKSRGQCGSIMRTAKRRLFPFTDPEHGRWQLQFDTRKTYTRGSKFLFYTVGVNVHQAKS
jgi:hypothetical protein